MCTFSSFFRANLPDPEEDQKFHKDMNIGRSAIAFLQIAPLIVLIYYLNKYGCLIDQRVPVSWLWGHIILRTSVLFGNCCKPPYKKLRSFWKIYNYVNLLWIVYGIISTAWSIIHIKNTGYVANDSPIFMTAILVFGIDIFNLLQFFSCMDYERKQYFERPLPPRRITNLPVITQPPVEMQEVVIHLPPTRNIAPQPGVQTHSFYTECSICKIDFTKEDTVKDLPCKHLFHPGCIDPWLGRQNRCPLCNYELDPIKN